MNLLVLMCTNTIMAQGVLGILQQNIVVEKTGGGHLVAATGAESLVTMT